MFREYATEGRSQRAICRTPERSTAIQDAARATTGTRGLDLQGAEPTAIYVGLASDERRELRGHPRADHRAGHRGRRPSSCAAPPRAPTAADGRATRRTTCWPVACCAARCGSCDGRDHQADEDAGRRLRGATRARGRTEHSARVLRPGRRSTRHRSTRRSGRFFTEVALDVDATRAALLAERTTAKLARARCPPRARPSTRPSGRAGPPDARPARLPGRQARRRRLARSYRDELTAELAAAAGPGRPTRRSSARRSLTRPSSSMPRPLCSSELTGPAGRGGRRGQGERRRAAGRLPGGPQAPVRRLRAAGARATLGQPQPAPGTVGRRDDTPLLDGLRPATRTGASTRVEGLSDRLPGALEGSAEPPRTPTPNGFATKSSAPRSKPRTR